MASETMVVEYRSNVPVVLNHPAPRMERRRRTQDDLHDTKEKKDLQRPGSNAMEVHKAHRFLQVERRQAMG
jgi:hypothetical protein